MPKSLYVAGHAIDLDPRALVRTLAGVTVHLLEQPAAAAEGQHVGGPAEGVDMLQDRSQPERRQRVKIQITNKQKDEKAPKSASDKQGT